MTHPKPTSTFAPSDLGSIPPIDATIVRLLSQPPAVTIPDDFARRIARQAAAQPLPRPSLLMGWGPRAALASGVLLTAALFLLAPHTAPSLSSIRFDAELLLFTELGAVILLADHLLHRE